MFFTGADDRLAWQVTYAYPTLLIPQPESDQVHAQQEEQPKAKKRGGASALAHA